jgi:hypothetical protein
VGIVALLCALVALPGAPVLAWQTAPPSAPNVTTPTVTIASGELTRGSATTDLAWLVRTDPAASIPDLTDADFPLAFIVARRGTGRIHGEPAAFRAPPAPAPGMRLARGQVTRLASSMTGPDLTVQLALVPAATLPAALPPGVIASEPFTLPGPDRLHLELREGIIAPGQTVRVLADEAPALLVSLDRSLLIDRDRAVPGNLPPGAMTLLTTTTTIRNPSARAAAFVVTWIAPSADDPASAMAGQGARDPALDEAWRRYGCHLNPSNPACLTVSLAAACALDRSTPGCDADSDADSCRDVAEVRIGLDPFDPNDCLGDRDGWPLVNCLFTTTLLPCNGRRDGGITPRPAKTDCAPLARDPTCDGFAPGTGQERFTPGGITVATRR